MLSWSPLSEFMFFLQYFLPLSLPTDLALSSFSLMIPSSLYTINLGLPRPSVVPLYLYVSLGSLPVSAPTPNSLTALYFSTQVLESEILVGPAHSSLETAVLLEVNSEVTVQLMASLHLIVSGRM